MGSYDSSITLLKEAMNITQNKYDEDNADNYILRAKSAVVIWYQPMTLIACVRFCEDKNENEYHLYNRCCAFLSPGDVVKVFYTTNAAKGWIMVRCGKPNFLNEYGQKIYDIRNCCDDDDDGGDCCCETDCCSEAATRQTGKDTQVIEEWDERIEGTEEEIREYEENEGRNSPFYRFENGGEG